MLEKSQAGGLQCTEITLIQQSKHLFSGEASGVTASARWEGTSSSGASTHGATS